jgi:hypothetical protein
MTYYTVRTFHSNNQWVKITRDYVGQEFFFAKGYEGETCARHMTEIPFKQMKTWREAIKFALKVMSR